MVTVCPSFSKNLKLSNTLSGCPHKPYKCSRESNSSPAQIPPRSSLTPRNSAKILQGVNLYFGSGNYTQSTHLELTASTLDETNLGWKVRLALVIYYLSSAPAFVLQASASFWRTLPFLERQATGCQDPGTQSL